VYDANGNKVEENVSGTIHEYVSAFGVTAQMTGQTENSTIVPLPGGVQALYSGGALQRFRYPDWQGTIRAESNPSTRAFTESLAFAPFGERYALKGAPFNVDSFTGKPDQLVPDEYDFPAREEHNGQGRWTSPDPMRGTGNKYVYADNNPLSKVDLYGLFPSNEGVDYTGDDGISSDPSSEPLYQQESHPPVSVQTGGQIAPQLTEQTAIRADQSAQDQSVTWNKDGSVTVTAKTPKSFFGKIFGPIGSWFGAVGVVLSRSIGGWGGPRAGKPFTSTGKQVVINRNAALNEGQSTCVSCGRPTVPATQSQSGVTPAGDETRVDHIWPQSKLGNGDPETNGQVLCFDCNAEKSDSMPIVTDYSEPGRGADFELGAASCGAFGNGPCD